MSRRYVFFYRCTVFALCGLMLWLGGPDYAIPAALIASQSFTVSAV